MSDSNLEPASTGRSLFRMIMSYLDYPAYALLGIVYELFFNVASADLFSNETIMKFYGRVQIILGVFMMFQLALTILKGIVDPDSFTGKNGAGTLITRVVTSLILITLLMPISIPNARNEYEKQINNNGLLFGTLYSLQHRILSNNTIGRLVLGTNDSNSTFQVSNDGSDNDLKKSARIFTSTILKGFYRINLVPEDQRNKAYLSSGKDPATYNENRVCKNIDEPILKAYTRVDAEPSEIIGMVNETCDSEAGYSFLNSVWTGLQTLTGTTKYIFAYSPFISFIVPLVFVFILLSFTVDVAVRAVKLAVLRLIAPIPLISYMDPKGGKDSAFNAWVKALTSTYLDLFIRLATIYFVIFLIQDMIVNGIVIDLDARSGVLGVASLIVIWFGLFIFAKQAPKFIRQVLGLKDDAGGKLFGGFGEIAAVGAAGLGIVGSVATGWRAAGEENAAFEREREAEAIRNGVPYHPHNIRNAGRRIVSAIGGGIGGAGAGVHALMGKDASASSVMSAQNQRNTRRAAHSTLPGRVEDSLYGLTHGRSLAALDQTTLDANKSAASSIKSFKTTAVDEAMKKGLFGTVTASKDRFHRLGGIEFNYRQLEAAMSTKDTAGNFDYTDRHGTIHHLNAAWFDSGVMSDIEDSQTSNYLAAEWNGSGFNNSKINTDWRNAHHDMSEAGITYNGAYLGQASYGDIGTKIGEANSNVADMSTNMRHIMHRANNQSKK